MLSITNVIDKAFHGTIFPGRENICASPNAMWELEPLLASESQWRDDWKKIPEKLIAKKVRDILPLLSSDGYKFFLPAFMKAALRAITDYRDDDYGTLLMFVIFSLCPSDPFGEYHMYQISQLNEEQKNAIMAFLRLVRQCYADDSYDDLILSVLETKVYGDAQDFFNDVLVPKFGPYGSYPQE